MAKINEAKFTTPDGVERTLRFTQGAQYRIAVEKERNNGQVPHFFIAWAMMFGKDGNPPADLPTAAALGEELSPIETPRLLAAISEATTGGVLQKKIVDAAVEAGESEMKKMAGAISGLSLESNSESPETPQAEVTPESSGGSRRKNSTRSANSSPAESADPARAQAS